MAVMPNPWLSESPLTMEVFEEAPAGGEPLTAGATDRFILDVEAFMNDIEPMPAFLSAPSQRYLTASEITPVLKILAGYL